nr:hypothetical protein [Tanacetum cinerariifolium]
MSTLTSSNGNVLFESDKNSSLLKNPGWGKTGVSRNADDGAIIADGAGKIGAVEVSGIEVVGHTCLSGISVSDSESSEHKKGETIGAIDTRGSELSDGSASNDE